ncbi:MAG: hypothetical protein PHU70_08370, partial [Dehalococcoidia bacterium]|nr:hypothetical protein [Dehalococcoidia bacterium]
RHPATTNTVKVKSTSAIRNNFFVTVTPTHKATCNVRYKRRRCFLLLISMSYSSIDFDRFHPAVRI